MVDRAEMSARAGVLAPHTLATASPGLTGAVAAIGNFDGVHRGHTVLLETAMAVARERGLAALALTFEPHPRTIFKPEAPVFRLTPLSAKARILTAVGLDGLCVIPFDRTFSTLTADAFVEDILVDRLRIEGVVVGRDFHFGKGRGGSPATLAAHGRSLGFSVTVVDPVVGDSGETVSSSSIRDALAAGDIAMANDLLGHRWFIVGEVVAGDRRGRTLGFPTANIRLPADCRLRHGVYAVVLRRADGTVLGGVASYGRRPTFDDGPPLLEVFAFDFSGDLYGESVIVVFLEWVRAEEKFSSVDALVEAIKEDAAEATAIVAAAGPGNALDKTILHLR
jgi:riboflavin kinase/FMN adenylyltransferase